jgi:hypothetical protein
MDGIIKKINAFFLREKTTSGDIFNLDSEKRWAVLLIVYQKNQLA